jgi:transcriptional regulator with XRE-family HTH domain
VHPWAAHIGGASHRVNLTRKDDALSASVVSVRFARIRRAAHRNHRVHAMTKHSPATERIDDYVGTRIRERRISLGLTQSHLAKAIGITYQQTHKYEQGINRVSAGRLYEIAHALDVPITYFYENAADEKAPQIAPHPRPLLEIARNFTAIENGKHREALNEVARILAGR